MSAVSTSSTRSSGRRGGTTIWGGGISAQQTLARGTVEDVDREVRAIGRYFKRDGGFVFNDIHNILAEVPPEKVLAMYRAAAES